MARNLFHWNELPNLEDKVLIKPPFEALPEEDECESDSEKIKREIEEYTGPTVEDIKNEVEAYKNHFEVQKQQMLKDAKDEADFLFHENKKKADDLILQAQKEADNILMDAEEKARQNINNGRKKIKEEKDESEAKLNEIIVAATEKGEKEGYALGFARGEEEGDRLISKLHSIVGGIVSKRKEILEDSEAEVIALVLQIASRVVKVISETQKDVVIQNVKSALAKVKSRTDIIIRVNLEDLELTTSKMKEFQNKVEKVKHITIVEDATVDRGGCIIETDFGQIDARISQQLREIESKISSIAPMREIGVNL